MKAKNTKPVELTSLEKVQALKILLAKLQEINQKLNR